MEGKILKMNKPNSWFFEKIKIYKPLATLTKTKREDQNKIINKKEAPRNWITFFKKIINL